MRDGSSAHTVRISPAANVISVPGLALRAVIGDGHADLAGHDVHDGVLVHPMLASTPRRPEGRSRSHGMTGRGEEHPRLPFPARFDRG